MTITDILISGVIGAVLGLVNAFLFTWKSSVLTNSSPGEEQKDSNVGKIAIFYAVNFFIRYAVLAVLFGSVMYFMSINIIICLSVFMLVFWGVLLKRMKHHEH